MKLHEQAAYHNDDAGSNDEEPLLTTYTEEDLKELNRREERLRKKGLIDTAAPHLDGGKR